MAIFSPESILSMQAGLTAFQFKIRKVQIIIQLITNLINNLLKVNCLNDPDLLKN